MSKDSFEDDMPLLDGVDDLPAGAFTLPEAPATMRAELLARTSGVVRRRRILRRVGTVAAALVLYGAGALTMALLDSTVERASSPITRAERPDATASSPREPSEGLPRDPRHLEERLLAMQLTDAREVLRRAGDRYLLSESGDVDSALYCYRRMFDGLPRAGLLELKPDDTWLLTILKIARIEEKH